MNLSIHRLDYDPSEACKNNQTRLVLNDRTRQLTIGLEDDGQLSDRLFRVWSCFNPNAPSLYYYSLVGCPHQNSDIVGYVHVSRQFDEKQAQSYAEEVVDHLNLAYGNYDHCQLRRGDEVLTEGDTTDCYNYCHYQLGMSIEDAVKVPTHGNPYKFRNAQ